jgi:hypothetical protein
MARKRQPRARISHHLSHWLVPHHKNDHRPHLIRVHGLALTAAIIIAIQVGFNVLRAPGVQVLAYATDITPVALLNLTNQERAAAGQPPLKLDSQLNTAAAYKSQNMFQENYWAHVSPSGIQPWYWFQQAGYVYLYAGENLAKDFDTSAGVVQGWMNSAGHKANLLNKNYTEVGFSVQNGTLQGGQTTLVVAHYGSRNTPAPVAAAPAPAAATPAVRSAARSATPVPTAVPTPAPTTPPTATPTSSPNAVVAANTPNTSAPAGQSYSLFAPLSLTKTLNLATLLTLGLLVLLLGVYTWTHYTVWRKGLQRWARVHYRVAAAGQVSSLTTAIIMLAVSGFGSVG